MAEIDIKKKGTKRKSSTSKSNKGQRSRREAIRWFVGFILLLSGLYSLLSVIFYFNNWQHDYNLVMPSTASGEVVHSTQSVLNSCGPSGAWIAQQLIGESFGIVGVVIPILLILFGIRVIRSTSMKFNYTALVSVMLLILGSSTLGFIFEDRWSMFGSGVGGAYGITLSNIVTGSLGDVGMILILIGGWIALGVFVNRNFIDKVNNAGDKAIDSGGKVVDMIKGGVKIATDRKQKSVDTSEQIDDREVEDESPFIESEEEQSEIYDEGEEIEEINIESDPDPQSVEEPLLDENGIEVIVETHDEIMVSEAEAEADNLYDPLKDLYNYQRPPVSLLEDYQSNSKVTDDEIFANKCLIEETLKHFGIPITKIKATVGPTITLYEINQAQGVKISRIQGLENDIAQSLKAETGIRIIAPIPGRGTIGIEVPNINKQVVSMYSSILAQKFQEMKAELPVVIGRTIQDESYVFDLAKMPHLLVAGATGQGKSVGLNAIITSLLYRKHPSQLKFVMIDPKMVEFTPYRALERHFMARMESEDDVIITDPKKAVNTLNALCEEMEKRLKLLSEASVRNIIEYNSKFVRRRILPTQGHFYMPYIVVIVDEFADLIMMSREVETPVMRLAQKARAVGIHLIIATQRPDVKVITGGIKANFPARIAFRVMQMIDSRTIIDQPGANQLIGRGDLLFKKDGELVRVQCALVETEEVERIVDHISGQQGYSNPYLLPDYSAEGGGDGDFRDSDAPQKYDQLFAEIARAAVSGGMISTSAIQRNYEVGFNRAGRIMSQLERAGIVGRKDGAKSREILFYDIPSLEAKLQSLGLF